MFNVPDVKMMKNKRKIKFLAIFSQFKFCCPVRVKGNDIEILLNGNANENAE